MALEQGIERRQQDLGVARAGKALAGAAQRFVLLFAALAPQLPFEQPHDGAQALDRLACIMDRPGIEFALQRPQREVGLLQGERAQGLGRAFARTRPRARPGARPGPCRGFPAAAALAQLAVAEPRQGETETESRTRSESGREGRDNVVVTGLPQAPWWTVRRAANRKPSTYRCPICGHHLPALSEHMLIAPEGDSRRRRHAHTDCVLRERAGGRLVLRDEWLARQPRGPSLWSRLRGRVRG